jgi:hypothetical protein
MECRERPGLADRDRPQRLRLVEPDVLVELVITDRFSGQSRGFGFVEMSMEAEAQPAIAKLGGRP